VRPSEGSAPASRSPVRYRVPRATYRIQFNAGFTFRDATTIVPYLAELGVSDLYASPYLMARPGSLHGYDIVDHGSLNPEIGDEHDHARLSAALREHGMGHLLDIVPNHMGIAAGANRWWTDVLENGPSSRYAPYFDIDWRPLKAEMRGKVLLPVLGDQFGAVLERGELRLDHAGGRFRLDYHGTRFPVAPRSTAAVLNHALALLELDGDDPDRMELESLVTALGHLPSRSRTDPESVAERRREKVVTQRRLAALYDASGAVRRALDEAVRHFNGTPGDPASFDLLDAMLDDQAYRLAFWRVAAEEINYRRFFDVNDLAGVRVERPEVFQATHRLVLGLVREGKVTGLRIDHPDGLYDPRGYLRELQAETVGIDAQAPFYVLVEKILTGDEELPDEWPVAGTVGYEYLNRLNGLFVAGGNEEAMDAVYRRFARSGTSIADLVYEKKERILRASLVSELTVLATLLNRLSEANRHSRDFTFGSLRDALRETIACFPVYRTYIEAEAGAVSARDRHYVDVAIAAAKRRNRGMTALIFDFVRSVLLLEWPDSLGDDARAEHALFVMKFQQLTGPVMAKGVEDTAFYVFNRLVSMNEVGGELEHFGVAPAELHRYHAHRAERWPHAMNAGSTHDTKRSEDVRARINVLSELPDLWGEHVYRWALANAELKRHDDDVAAPDANDEYLLYQTLVGAWPLEGLEEAGHEAFVERIVRYMEKATREAKEHTSWINANEAYDAALEHFVRAVLRRGGENAFVEDFARFHEPVARMGMLNSLAQTLVRLTAPGVPDVYQGQELLDFSLVDPDNRRPVDYAHRRRLLEALEPRLAERDRGGLARELVDGWRDGRVKLYLTACALRLRRALPAAFRDGAYVPLEPRGERATHLFAFARTGGGDAAVTVVPRLVATMMRDRGFALPEPEDWGDARIELPEALEGTYRNVFTGEEVRGEWRVGELLGSFPAALLRRVEG
jgi:(1->4)-alpha-D-glucan 1-alpha-D-glucosylmutase